MTTHLQLSVPAELTLEAAEGDTDGTPRRTLIGQAVPWGVTARVSSGQLVRFEPGSLNLSAQPVVRDHDSTRPVGVVATAQDTDAGHQVAIRLSATPLGDESLTLAADGVLTGMSVGASATEYTWDLADPDDPVMVVSAATPRELSLLVSPAYGDASRVSTVAAATPDPTPNGDTMDTPDTFTVAAIDAAGSDDQGPTDIDAGTPARARVVAEPALAAEAYVVEAILAQRGDSAARDLIEAALTSQVTTDNLGVVPPQYVAGILGGLDVYRPVYDSLQHGTLPAAGNTLVRPKWTTLPVVAKHNTENTEAPTGAVSIGNVQVDKDSWSHAVLVSLQLLNRSDPGYANEYYRAAAQSFYAAFEYDLSLQLGAAAPAPTAEGATGLEAIAAAVRVAVNQQLDANGVFTGVWPSWALVGMDVWGDLVSTTDGPAMGSGSATIATPQGTVSGITVRACPTIADAEVIAGHPQVATAYTAAQLDLRALVVNTMSAELGFYTDTAMLLQNDKVLGSAAMVPAVAAPVARSAKK